MNEYKLFESPRIEKLVALFLLIAAVFVAFLALNEVREAFAPRLSTGNIISVQGTGTVTAIPDIATLSFTVTEEAETVSEAQDRAAEASNAAIAALQENGIEEADITTASYSVSPKYSYPRPCYGECPPVFEDAKIVGYTVSQSVTAKVRDTATVGAVLSALGEKGVSNLYGPNFTVDDPDALRAEARREAIADAREKARALSRDLGVRLVRVTGFWEEGPYLPYYSEKAYGLGGAEASVIPDIPIGEGEVTVSINVSYEIR